MSDTPLSVTFDGSEILQFVQGEERTFKLFLLDTILGEPLDLSAAAISVRLPACNGGSILRCSQGKSLVVSHVDAAIVGQDASLFYCQGHGLCRGDALGLDAATAQKLGIDPGASVAVHCAIDADAFSLSVNGAAFETPGDVLGPITLGAPTCISPLTDAQGAPARLDAGLCNLGLSSNATAATVAGDASKIIISLALPDTTRIIVLPNSLDVTAGSCA